MLDRRIEVHTQASRPPQSALLPSQVAVSTALLLTLTTGLIATALDAQKTSQATDANSPLSSWTLNEDSWNQWWSYSGVSGPAYWGLLNSNWFMCDRGRRQSPIDLETKALVYDPHLAPLRADNNLISGVLYNDGHSIVFNGSQVAVARSIWLREQTAIQNSSNLNATNPMIDTENKHLISKRRPEASKIFSLDEHSARVHLIDFGDGFEIESSDGDSTSEARIQRLGLAQQQQPMLLREAANGVELANGADSEPSQPVGTLDTDALENHNLIHLSGAGLAYSYRFEIMQFKYGPTDSEAGSEHRIDGRAFAAELQIFAYNWQLYKSYDDATNRPQGLLAVSLLVDAIAPIGRGANQNKDNPAQSSEAHHNQKSSNDGGQQPTTKHRNGNEQLERLLVSAANSLQHRGAFESHREFNLSALLVDGGDQFVTYEGSLTQPGCHETVTWLVLNRPLYVASQILEKLRSLSADEQSASNPTGSLIAGNTRPTQPINNRPIRTNIRPHRLTNSESSTPSQEFCPRLRTRYRYTHHAAEPPPMAISGEQMSTDPT